MSLIISSVSIGGIQIFDTARFTKRDLVFSHNSGESGSFQDEILRLFLVANGVPLCLPVRLWMACPIFVVVEVQKFRL